MAPLELDISPLSRGTFAPFGDVIEVEGSDGFTINDGFATRYHDLARVDVLEGGGRPLINIFRARPWPQPIGIRMMERHPLSSQAFVPLSPRPFLMVVASPGQTPDPARLRAFVTNGRQGVNYHRGVWHHPLLALERETDFLVVDRGAEDGNCDEFHFDQSDCQIVLDQRTITTAGPDGAP
jgi:ureidoglycolate lyase